MNPRQRAKLWRVLMDTFVPFPKHASRVNTQNETTNQWEQELLEVIEAVIRVQPMATRQDTDRVLALLDSPWLGLTWGGPHTPFIKLDREDRERLLRRWAGSPVPMLRKAFLGLKQLACFLHYAWAVNGKNPHWPRIAYPGAPQRLAGKDPELTLVSIESVQDIETVVIGSGAGGAVAAALRAEAGESVLLLEKGPFVPPSKMTDLEADAFASMYEAAGSWRNVRGDLTLLAGACVGGGTTVNWAGSFEPTAHVLKEWAEQTEIPELESTSFKASVVAVQTEASVNTNHSWDNAQNKALRRGSEQLGHQDDLHTIPRNAVGCDQADGIHCGYCGFGCKAGCKQDATQTWLPRAARAGAVLAPLSKAVRLHFQAGRIHSVEVQSADGKNHRIRCKRVVLAAGALHTAGLLLNSGAKHPWIGRPFFVHPVLGATAFYKQPMEAWSGVMMSTVNDRFNQLDHGYGFKIETPPVHPGLISLGLPWRSSKQHFEMMEQAAHAATFIVLTRDRKGGRVRLDREGRPRLFWRTHPDELRMLKRGLSEAMKIHAAADADWAVLPHRATLRVNLDDIRQNPARADEIIESIRWRPHEVPLFSAHQMGSCRMGNRPNLDPVDSHGRLRGFKGVHVADGSLFPTASGVNPMITIQALTHWVTTRALSSP